MYFVSIEVQNVMLTLNRLNQTITEISNLFDDKYFHSQATSVEFIFFPLTENSYKWLISHLYIHF